MHPHFRQDLFPGRPKVLFIGWPESSHTHSFIDLLDAAELNVRFFALPSAVPPAHWHKRSYITTIPPAPLDPRWQRQVHPPRPPLGYLYQAWNFAQQKRGWQMPRFLQLEFALATAIRDWKPDIIHTLGLDPASYLYLRTREQYGLQGQGVWVAQARGGPELALHQHLESEVGKIKSVMASCDYLMADNAKNYEFAVQLGLDPSKLSPLGVVPGTGGMDVDLLGRALETPPSKRGRVIVWPKAYEAPAAKALPVFEALKMVWDRIKPCRIDMLWVVQNEFRMWFALLPPEIRESCVIHDRVPREKALELIRQARVMLAPSVTDGVPNTMLEAFSMGTFPIVSPLETITPVVEDRTNVLMARNLYPHEIGEALVTAMSDDLLVDQAAVRNLELVKRIANRATIGPQLIEWYNRLARVQKQI